MAEGPSEETRQNCTFFKKPARGKNIRKRTTEEDGDDEGPAVVRKTKSAKKGGYKSADKVEEKTNFFYESSREIQSQSDSLATAANETETEFDRDARAIRERILKNADEALKKKDDESASAPAEKSAPLYKGINAYTDHRAGFRRENTIAAEKAGGAHGPLRASANFRNSVRVDYQPDICKDYKETGYCGYGDSCKFLHDRGDYKSGWQLDRDWEEAQKAKKQRLLEGLGEEDEKAGDEDEDELPFACFICRESFVDPVVTSCKHYFCEHCALKHHSRNKNCYVCNKATNGLFNTAHEIIKKAKNAPNPG